MISQTHKYLFWALLCSISCFAQDTFQSKFNDSLKKLNDLDYESFAKSVNDISGEVNRLLDYQRKVCSGEFSPLVITNSKSETEEVIPKRLSRKEKKECLEKVDKENIKYLNTLYSKRINYLNQLHEKRINSLKASLQLELGNVGKKRN